MLRTHRSKRALDRAALAAFAALAMAACGGGDSPTARQLSVGGTYPTQVALLPTGNTCGSVSTQSNPTLVAHDAGSSALALTHAGNTYSGTVQQTGIFTAGPTAVSNGAFVISMAGQFTEAGFTAAVHVAQQQPSCAYDVSWTGTKTGPPNTFP